MFPYRFNTQLFNERPKNVHALGTIPEYIEVKTATGSTVAFLSPDPDGIKSWIDNELNGSCKLDIELPMACEKWAYLTDAYRIYAGGKEFVIANADAIEVSRDGEKLWGKVTANESWVLLGKKYPEAGITNDGSPAVPLKVTILSGGSDLSGGRFAVGSAGHALYALLLDTGWSVGTVDVGGIFDLETEKISTLANINKVQELWGGLLDWDSANKIVSLRNEATWLNYTGFGIRYRKNLKSITRTDDYNIVTRLYPFGADDLNIGSVNNGVLYIENHSYTADVLIDVWENQEITEASKLLPASTSHLAKICRPRHSYKTQMLDMRTVPGYEHETFSVGHLTDLVDEELGIDDQARITRHKYNVFQPWLNELEVGDPIKKIAATIASAVQAANYVKNSIKPNAGFQNLLKAIIDTAATEINGASGDYTCIDGVETRRERDEHGNLTGNLTRDTPRGYLISSDGGQTWDLAINGKGINAAMVNTGKLLAEVVQIGAASSYETGYNPLTALTTAQNAALAAQNAQDTADDKCDAPGYVAATADGFKVYDASNALRVLLGSWVVDAVRKYGLQVFNGEIYSSLFKTAVKSATNTYIEMGSESNGQGYLRAVNPSGRKVVEMGCGDNAGGFVFWNGTSWTGQIMTDGTNQVILLFAKDWPLKLQAANSYINIANNGAIEINPDGSNQITLNSPTHVANSLTTQGSLDVGTNVQVWGDLNVSGTTKNCIQVTQNYGLRALAAREGPELRYLDEGVSSLQNGECFIHVNPIFAECIEPHSMTTPWVIQLTPCGRGSLYYEIAESGFIVKSDDAPNLMFSWTLSAIKKDCEGIYLTEVILDGNN